MRVRTVTVLTAAALLAGGAVVAASTGTVAGAAPAPPAANPALVTDAAARGGPVIVTLRAQYPQLTVKRHAAQRRAAVQGAQSALIADLRRHGATAIRQLVSVDAVAATVPADEIARLAADPAVARIQQDSRLQVAAPAAGHAGTFAPGGVRADVAPGICPADPTRPLLEPEALGLTHYLSQPARPDDAAPIATGAGVRIGLTGINRLAGNPNFIRPGGEHVVVDSPTPDADDSNFAGGGDEWYGDASSISGQGTVVYDLSHELPYSGLPKGCTIRIVGIAPGASLVDTGFYGQGVPDPSDGTLPESQVIAGLDHAALDEGVSVVSESYGSRFRPGRTDVTAVQQANDALVAAGITVVESSGDSGTGGTVGSPADDPLIIDAGASTALRQSAQAWGYDSWLDDQVTALSSGGTTATNHVVDLVAPGFGGEATCSPKSATCPQDTFTEAFGGTSQSAPFIAGAAADVIEAYGDSHGGAQPTPALVKALLTGTARDLGAASDDQGAGLLDVGAAVRAARQAPGSTLTDASSALVPSPTQLNVAGAGASTSAQPVTLYNASNTPTTVTGALRSYGPATTLGAPVTEAVTAPARSLPIPAAGAPAAAPITMAVPAGVDELGVDMITPNPRNDAVLCLLLFDPAGRLAQVSYDYSSTNGKVSNNEHVAVDHPAPGNWTARVVWNNGRAHLQDPPPVPGDYRGDISVRFTARNQSSAPLGTTTTIPAHASATVPVAITLPSAPGDAPATAVFTTGTGATVQVPVTRRTLVPASGGEFTATLGSSVARETGPLKTFAFDVPAGAKDLRAELTTADTAPDNVINYLLTGPDGRHPDYDRTPNTTTRGAGAERGRAALVTANPKPGRWTLEVQLDLTTSGREFTQDVHGTLAFDTAQVQAVSVPHSAATVVPRGQNTVLQVAVVNTTGVGRAFALFSPSDDVSAARVYLPAGASATLRAVLRPSQAPGTRVNTKLVVDSFGSAPSPLLAAEGLTYPPQSLAVLPLKYTVGGPGKVSA